MQKRATKSDTSDHCLLSIGGVNEIIKLLLVKQDMRPNGSFKMEDFFIAAIAEHEHKIMLVGVGNKFLKLCG